MECKHIDYCPFADRQSRLCLENLANVSKNEHNATCYETMEAWERSSERLKGLWQSPEMCYKIIESSRVKMSGPIKV